MLQKKIRINPDNLFNVANFKVNIFSLTRPAKFVTIAWIHSEETQKLQSEHFNPQTRKFIFEKIKTF